MSYRFIVSFYVFSLFTSYLSMFIFYEWYFDDFDAFSPGHSQYLTFFFIVDLMTRILLDFWCMYSFTQPMSLNAHNRNLRLNEKSLIHCLYRYTPIPNHAIVYDKAVVFAYTFSLHSKSNLIMSRTLIQEFLIRYVESNWWSRTGHYVKKS